ncbi:MAG: cupin domain-containing protein [Candidatus Heimdallarchaeota archaeon]|nr:cupin domain-containing protein [Candidatus Heimdallarchaeota archaeon]
MHRNIDDVAGIEISPGVFERVLMSKEEGDTEKMCSAHHYTLFDGGELVIENPMTEYQHYLISGRTTSGTADTAIFAPAGSHYPQNQAKGLRVHRLKHVGEGETRIFTVAHQVPRPAFRWAKSRTRHLFQVPSTHQTSISATQIFTEEEHAIMGALRFHAIDIQTHPPGQHKGTINEKGEYIGHRNPAEIMYFLRGTGKAMAEGVMYDVRPGSYLYTREGTLHGIWNTTNDILEYICMELIEHDKSWTERGYQGETNRPVWT